MVCKNCGAECAKGQQFCHQCGSRLEKGEENIQKNTPNNMPPNQKGNGLKPIVITCVLTLLVACAGFACVYYFVLRNDNTTMADKGNMDKQTDENKIIKNAETKEPLATGTPEQKQTPDITESASLMQTKEAPADTKQSVTTGRLILEPMEPEIVVEGNALEKRVTHIRENVYKPIINKQTEGKLRTETETLNGKLEKVTYYKEGSQIVKLEIKHGVAGREYYFEDGELCFAFVYTNYPKTDKEEERLYFVKERIFRYIYGSPPETGEDNREKKDNMFDSIVLTMEKVLFNDIKQYMPDKKFIWENKASVKRENINNGDYKQIFITKLTNQEIEYYNVFTAGDYMSVPYGKKKSLPISSELELYYSKNGSPNEDYTKSTKEKYNQIIATQIKNNGYGYPVWITCENNMVTKCEEVIFP